MKLILKVFAVNLPVPNSSSIHHLFFHLHQFEHFSPHFGSCRIPNFSRVEDMQVKNRRYLRKFGKIIGSLSQDLV